MEYFKIGSTDLSKYVYQLKVSSAANYTSQMNAAGDSVIDYVNTKHTIEVGFIYMEAEKMKEIQTLISPFSVSISFLNPETNNIESNMLCIVPMNDVEYYTIQDNKTTLKACKIRFIQL